MRAVIVYESMYGNTLHIAQAIAAGLRSRAEVSVLPVREVDQHGLDEFDLLVVGGPTHAWGMTRAATREQAITDGVGKGLTVVAQSGDPGLRDWLTGWRPADPPAAACTVAAFDTRIKAPAIFTGRATRGIRRRLRRHGLALSMPPASFFVSRNNQLLAGEADRARRWGRDLAELAASRVDRPSGQLRPGRRTA